MAHDVWRVRGEIIVYVWRVIYEEWWHVYWSILFTQICWSALCEEYREASWNPETIEWISRFWSWWRNWTIRGLFFIHFSVKSILSAYWGNLGSHCESTSFKIHVFSWCCLWSWLDWPVILLVPHLCYINH